jgi:hypothetical protein
MQLCRQRLRRHPGQMASLAPSSNPFGLQSGLTWSLHFRKSLHSGPVAGSYSTLLMYPTVEERGFTIYL